MSTGKSDSTVLFADICQSRQIYLTLGDVQGQKLVADCLALLTSAAFRHQGELIKTIGDEVLCLFPAPNMAVEAGMDMHRSLSTLPFAHPNLDRPSIHLGVHAGDVVRRDNDIFGDAVNVAARLTSMAKGGQILTTEQTLRRLPLDQQAKARFTDKLCLKGQSEEYSVFEVIWEAFDLTVMCACPRDFDLPRACLIMRYRDQCIEVDRSRPIITLGRHKSSDIQVNAASASRIHARIEQRKGKFILVDLSTNGTHVFTENGQSFLVHRDESALSEDGFLGLGQEVAPDSEQAIAFTFTKPVE